MEGSLSKGSGGRGAGTDTAAAACEKRTQNGENYDKENPSSHCTHLEQRPTPERGCALAADAPRKFTNSHREARPAQFRFSVDEDITTYSEVSCEYEHKMT